MPQHRSDDQKALALSLRDQKKSLREIQAITGIPKSTIAVWEQELKGLEPLAETYAQNRITILRGHQLKVLDGLAKDDLIEVPPVHKVKMLKDLWEMERVEAGKSTQNIGHTMYQMIMDVRKGIKAKEEVIDITQS